MKNFVLSNSFNYICIMKKYSTCCHADIHHQNDVDFCTECIRILNKSEVKTNIRPIVLILTTMTFLYMVLNTSYAYAPSSSWFNMFNGLNSEKPIKYAVDYLQVKIIEGDESNAVSIAGATGNMQIMPVTLEDWNQQHPNQQYTMDDMKNESKNVKVGRWMLETRIPQILKSEHIPLTVNIILIAYNWGCGNAINWYKSGSVVSKLPDETQQYICKYWAKAKI